MAITAEEIAAIKELQAQGFGPYQISAQVGAIRRQFENT